MNRNRSIVVSLCASLGLASTLALAPSPAEACGGLFCDGGPQPMPVDQTGEDILFVADGESVEVHIRIQYEGEPQDFAWVIPVLSVPTDFQVGSEALFTNIKAASVPTYGIATQPDDCSIPNGEAPPGDPDNGAGEGTSGTGAGGDDGGPTIFAQETVGAYEITVLGDGTVEEVIAWLDTNGYQQDPEAEPIIAEYLAEGHYFAAIKLTGNADVDELHPIALTFDHTEPCVPLRLTRIAASDDMDVRTYFLGQARVVPKTYRHVLVNPLKIDWINQAANYKDVITRAVDAEHADGRAFVTEYAGGSEIVSQVGLDEPGWNADAFVAMNPEDVPAQLQLQGLQVCGWDPNTGLETCAGANPMVDPILDQFLPVPDGVDPYQFYVDTATYVDLIDPTLWDGQAFADLLQQRVLTPSRHAADLLTRHPYLTRMYTTISPHEMIEDPMFHENPDLEEIVASRTGTQRILCTGDNVWTLPDGREVFVPAGAAWPDIGGDNYWEEEVQETPPAGPPVVLVNNTAAIDQALADWNAQNGWAGPPEIPGGETGESDGSDTDGGGSAGGSDNPESSEGCGCRVDHRGAYGAFALLALGILFRRRRGASGRG